MDVLNISCQLCLCIWVYLIHALQLVCRWGVTAGECLIFPHEAEGGISVFWFPLALDSCLIPPLAAVHCSGDPYLPPELQSAQKLAKEVGKEAGWLTLRLLESKQWKQDTAINSQETNAWCRLQSACAAQLRADGDLHARDLQENLSELWVVKAILKRFVFSDETHYFQNSSQRVPYKKWSMKLSFRSVWHLAFSHSRQQQ